MIQLKTYSLGPTRRCIENAPNGDEPPYEARAANRQTLNPARPICVTGVLGPTRAASHVTLGIDPSGHQ
jgi:hypothetical protein